VDNLPQATKIESPLDNKDLSMNAAMTSRERIRAALEGQAVDHLPFCPFLAYVWESFGPEIQEAGQLAFHHVVGADPLWRGAPCPTRFQLPDEVTVREREDADRIHVEIETPVGTLQQAHIKSTTGNTTFLVEHPLKTPEDFKIRTWIEAHTQVIYDPGEMQAHFADQGREGVSIGMLIPRSKSAYQSLVEHHVGTEALIYALVDYPEIVEALWQTMVEKDLEAAALALDADYDYYLTWEDSGTQNYSPRQYERYIASEIRQWCTLLAQGNKRYLQHACGHVRDILALLQESGPYGIESISPPPTGNLTMRQARSLVGDDFALIGGIEPTSFLNLPLKALGPYVESVIADLCGGPFLLANSDSCPPGVTVEKFQLVAEVAKAHQ
jgi:hypothetical protein